MQVNASELVLRQRIGENPGMPSVVRVTIHPSQFPEKIRRDLLASFQTRRANHKFHYDSVKQTQKWLALHERYSPARRDPDCIAIYERAFQAVLQSIKGSTAHVVGLGCGGGQKDVQLLRLLAASSLKLFYSPCDVSTAMVLTARKASLRFVPEQRCFPVVCDLSTADDLDAVLNTGLVSRRASRVVTFFGMIPNFEPQIILPCLASLVRRGDCLLFSANLAPGSNYSAGLKKILPQYDNLETRGWLLTFLFDAGVDPKDGELRFEIEKGPPKTGLMRVVARFYFKRPRRIQIGESRFSFRAGDRIRLFFSYRYTPDRVARILRKYGLVVRGQWITRSQEEGVFLCSRD